MDAALASRIADTCAGYPEIAAVWVFGSVANGTAVQGSDIDIAVLTGLDGLPAERQLALAAYLEAVSGRRVDLVLLSLRELILCHEVLTHGVLVYDADRERRVDFVSDALVRIIDFLPTWRISREGWLEGWRRSVGSGR